jgi:hypothetical protein
MGSTDLVLLAELLLGLAVGVRDGRPRHGPEVLGE